MGEEEKGEKNTTLQEGIKFSETQLIKFSYYFYEVVFQYFTCI